MSIMCICTIYINECYQWETIILYISVLLLSISVRSNPSENNKVCGMFYSHLRAVIRVAIKSYTFALFAYKRYMHIESVIRSPAAFDERGRVFCVT